MANRKKFKKESKRASLSRVNAMLNGLFDKQKEAFVYSKNNRIFCLCTRRAGKTYGTLAYMMAHASITPNSSYLYIALTRDQAKGIAWPIVRELVRKYKIKCYMVKQTLEIEFPNNSIIKFYGADREDLTERLVGLKCEIIVIDEADRFKSTTLENLAEEVLSPTIVDNNGRIILISTPYKIPHGYFYDIHMGKNKDYEKFKWSALDNPYVAENVKKEIARRVLNNPDYTDTPEYKRNWLGEYVVENKELCYRFDRERHALESYKKLPGDYFHIGVDLGWKDQTAFVVVASNNNRKEHYVVHSEAYSRLGNKLIAQKIKELTFAYPGAKVYCDASNKMTFEDISRQYKVRLMPAYKTRDKHEMIDWVNEKLNDNEIKFLDIDTAHVVQEISNLTWKETKKGELEEDPQKRNDCCDALLYAIKAAVDVHRYKKELELTDDEKEKIEFDKVYNQVQLKKQLKIKKNRWF